MLEKSFNPKDAEPRIYQAWEESGAFKPKMDTALTPYSIVIPPPNVTGSLHMGHALNNTLQDILIRFERMRGKDVLWQPGTDHAGIATQMVVERKLANEGQRGRKDMSREEFEAIVWEWKAESGGTIVKQLRRLGASCDWSRERFTMGDPDNPDDKMAEAVVKVFVQMYEEGLIYRDKRLVNWDPHFQTAISDLEVETKTVDGHYWHLKYPLAEGVSYEHPLVDDEGEITGYENRDYIIVATSRPETMLGDTAVAVHSEDKRYAGLIGKFIDLPIVGRRIPIIADDYADPKKGSGAVKITPAHDFNDYEVGKRAGHTPISILDTRAHILPLSFIPEAYHGKFAAKARKMVVAEFEDTGLLAHTETLKIEQPFGDRSGVVIEPMLTDQWFVKADILAEEALAAVTDGRTKFVPDNWKKTYDNWMNDIQPWCISRQLWWGHRIPAWYDEDGNITVAPDEQTAQKKAGSTVKLTRDPDVLDTWFSSGLWPFSTLGWPDKTNELARFYPGAVLVTAFDIIFFWVARMMMQGLHFMGEVPFKNVYIHALVLDEKGQKMSKSKGNVIDPLDIINEYGADALRFNMAAQAAQGRNVRLSMSRIEGYRNFGTKLWNAARFAQMNGCQPIVGFNPANCKLAVNQWVVSETVLAVRDVTRNIENYRFNDAADAAYKFARGVYADWYLELIKPVVGAGEAAHKSETQATAGWVLDQILKLLHPFMPFITEELWAQTSENRSGFLMSDIWPELSQDLVKAQASEDINWLIRLITALRSVRAEMNVPPSKKAVLIRLSASDDPRLNIYAEALETMGRVSRVETGTSAPKGALQTVVDGIGFAIPLDGLIDVSAERNRLTKEIDKTQGEIDRIDKKLGNANFVNKAPEKVVAEQHARRAGFVTELEKLKDALETMS